MCVFLQSGLLFNMTVFVTWCPMCVCFCRAAYVSFGGLLMRLKGDPNNLHGFEVDSHVYLMMKKLAFWPPPSSLLSFRPFCHAPCVPGGVLELAECVCNNCMCVCLTVSMCVWCMAVHTGGWLCVKIQLLCVCVCARVCVCACMHACNLLNPKGFKCNDCQNVTCWCSV